MNATNSSILILGGSGFVGATLVRELLGRGHQVTLLNRGRAPIEGTHQLIADRTNLDELQAAARTVGKIDTVIDTSSYSGAHSASAWEVFAPLTRNWVHLSSAAVYVEKATGYPNETDQIGGSAVWGQYGVEKSEADQFLSDVAGEVPVTIFRPPYLYGPGNTVDRETFIWARTLRNRPVIVPGNGQTPIQFLHIEDLAHAMILALQAPPERLAIYNIADGETPTLLEWVRTTARAAGFEDPSILAGAAGSAYPARQYFPFRDSPLCLDIEAIKTRLDFRPRYSLAAGLRQTYATLDVESLKRKALATEVEDLILAKGDGASVLI
jgi:nucleoside-diphosphate-sugar epimerase